jgi:cell division protein FtsW
LEFWESVGTLKVTEYLTIMQKILDRLQGDRVIWIVTIFLSFISILAVYSAISTLGYKADGNNSRFLFKQVLMISLGLGLMYWLQKIKLHYITRMSKVLVIISVILLAYAMFFGANLNNADRWIKLPIIGLTFQPSDMAKIALILHTARMLALKRDHLHDWKVLSFHILAPIICVALFIVRANFSTAALLTFVCFILMYLAGVPRGHLMRMVAAGMAAVLIVIIIGETVPKILPRYSTWKNRILNKASDDGDGNYQTDLAKYAIWEGGILPKGPGSSSTRNFMPHPYSDMIYPFIIEEYGSIIGGFGLVLLYMILFYRSIKLSRKNPKMSGQLTAIGLAFMLTLQAIINMSVAVSLIPTTGQPLPLVSMGGTSTLFTCLSIGLILSLTRDENNAGETDQEAATVTHHNTYIPTT